MNLKVTGEETNWQAQSVKKYAYSDYVHTSRLGSVVKPGGRWGRLAVMNPVQGNPCHHILYKKEKEGFDYGLTY